MANFGPDFGPFCTVLTQIWSTKIFDMDFTFARCYTLLQPIIVCNFKENL